MITKLFLIRHGTTGVTDSEQQPEHALSALGKEQVERLAQRLKRWGNCHLVYSSTFQRARESAAIIAKACGGTVQEDGRLNEIGVWTSPVQLHHPTKSPQEYQEAIRVLAMAQEKAVEFLTQIALHHPQEVIAVVCHGNIIRGIIAEALSAGVETVVRLAVDNASLSILEFEAGEGKPYFRLSLFNDTSHLV